MLYISIIGIILALIVLILLIMNGFSIVPATFISMIFLSLSSQIPYLELVENSYLKAAADFIHSYFLLFVAGTLMGKAMEVTGMAASIADFIIKKFGKRYALYGAMFTTMILVYCGVSVFVVVFTVYPIFLYTVRSSDLPVKLVPGAIMAACPPAVAMFPGAAQLNNLIPVRYLNTSSMAAPFIGILAAFAMILFDFFYFEHVMRGYRKSGEGFKETPAITKALEVFSDHKTVPVICACMPLIVMIIAFHIFHIDVFYAMMLGVGAVFILGWKNIDGKKKLLNEGIANVFGAIFTTAAAVGFGAAIQATPGFAWLLDVLLKSTFHPLISLSVSTTVIAGITGSSGGGTEVALKLFAEPFLQRGLNPQTMHRVVGLSSLGLSLLPHNGMVNTIFQTCEVQMKEGYRLIFWSSVIGAVISMIVAVGVGIFV